MLEISDYTKKWPEIQHIFIKELTEKFLIRKPHPHFYKKTKGEESRKSEVLTQKGVNMSKIREIWSDIPFFSKEIDEQVGKT